MNPLEKLLNYTKPSIRSILNLPSRLEQLLMGDSSPFVRDEDLKR